MRPRWLALLVVAGALLRAGYLVKPIMDADQATFGLQARHVLLGEFPVFSWGYAYIGTLTSFVTAVAFAVFGASRLVLNAVPLVLSLGFVVVTYRLGREMGGERVGLLAAALVAVAPPYLAIHGAWARHGYMDTLLLGSLVLLVALRLTRRPLAETREVRLFALLGLAGGLAWWTNFLSLFYLIPAALLLVADDWRRLGRRGPWVALAFFLLGSAPFWLFNVLHALWSFALFKGGESGAAPVQLLRVAGEGLPAILGARSSQGRTNWLPGISHAVVAAYAVAFAWLAWRVLSAWSRRRRAEPGLVLLLLFFGAAALLVGLSRFGEEIGAGGTKRYLLPLYSALPLLYAGFVARARELGRPVARVLVALPLVLHGYGNLVTYREFLHELPAFRLARVTEAELFAALEARGLTRVYVTDYWLGPRLTFDAGEAIVFALPFGERYPPYVQLLDAAPRVAYLFAAGAAGPFPDLLRGIGARFERTVVGPYEVFHDFREPAGLATLRSLPATGWRATASSAGTPPALAFDRDVDTSWYSGEMQRPGLYFEADLGRPTRVGKVVLLPPRPSIGVPRGYRVELSPDGRRWEETATVADPPWSLDWSGGQPRMGAPGRVVSAFEPREIRYLRVRQTGSDPTWWWAIGELFVYGAEGSGRPVDEAARALVERGRAHEAAGRTRDAAQAYWRATRVAPDFEGAHARLAVLYERTEVPVDGAVPPAERGRAFEAVGLWLKAAVEYEREVGQVAHHQHHTGVWRHLLAVYRQLGEAERARAVEERLAREFHPAVAAPATFEGQIRFLGYRLEPVTVVAGRSVRLTYYWESLKHPRKDYAVFVHFVRDGKVVFQHDHFPLDGAYPTSQWRPGEVIREPFEVVVPDGLGPGPCEIVVGLWDPQTGRRLGVKDTRLAHRKDRVVIGTLRVDRKS